MKYLLILVMVLFCTAGYSQKKKTTKAKATRAKTTTVTQSNRATNNQTGTANTLGTPGNTITDRRLNGTSQNRNNSSNQSAGNTTAQGSNRTTTTNNATGNGTFAGGIHPADNAKQQFDSVPPVNPNNINNMNDRNTTNATIAGGNDTTINVNTLTENGIPTNSGAVDKSGQSQFGQSNWGNSRGTIGESQWTVPPPITTSFNRDFPAISNATWMRNNLDTSIYSARYQSGAVWVTTNYNGAGQRLDTRSEIPLTLAPVPVHNYLARQPAGFKPIIISKVQMQGRPDMYEIQSSSGKTIYLNNEGNEVRQ